MPTANRYSWHIAAVGDRVFTTHYKKWEEVEVVKLGRKYAHVLSPNGNTIKIPYGDLYLRKPE